MFLPEKIKRIIADERFETDTVGMSEASVLVGKNKVLNDALSAWKASGSAAICP